MTNKSLQLNSTKLSENQRNLLNNKSNADVVLIVGEDKKEIYCHSFPLIATSKYYTAALKDIWQNRREDGKIVLNHPEFDEETIRAIVEFCYTGDVDVKEEIIPLIYEAADYLEIQELVNICVNELGNGLDDNAAFKFLQIAFKLDRMPLILHCLDVAHMSGWDSFFSQENLKNLSEELLVSIVTMFQNAFVDKWFLIKRWGYAQNDQATSNNDQKYALKKINDALTTMKNYSVILRFTDDEYETHLVPFLADILDVGVQNQFRSSFSQFKPFTSAVISFKKIESKVASNPALFQKISESIVARHFPTWTQFQKTNKRTKSNLKNTIVVSNTQNETKTLRWELLYRGSENSFSAAAFHRLSDGKGPTITLVKSTNGRVAAAYNSQDWNIGNIDIENPHGFILQVDMVGVEFITIRFEVADSYPNGTYNNVACGPIFGGVSGIRDLIIFDQCNENKNSYSDLGVSYEGPGASDTSLFGSKHFKVEEYEVFSVKFE